MTRYRVTRDGMPVSPAYQWMTEAVLFLLFCTPATEHYTVVAV